MRHILPCLLLCACSASPGREVAQTEPSSTPGPTVLPEPDCEPVACEVEVSSEAMAYFTDPGCTQRLMPVMGKQWPYRTLCEAGTGRVWGVVDRADMPARVWAGEECREMAADGLEWWTVVELDPCE